MTCDLCQSPGRLVGTGQAGSQSATPHPTRIHGTLPLVREGTYHRPRTPDDPSRYFVWVVVVVTNRPRGVQGGGLRLVSGFLSEGPPFFPPHQPLSDARG